MARPSVTFTSEFQGEFERETAALLSRRFLWYTGTVGAFYAFSTFVRALTMVQGMGGEGVMAAHRVSALVAGASAAVLFWASFLLLRRGRVARANLGRLVFWLIVSAGSLQLASGVVGSELSPQDERIGALIGLAGTASILFTHVLAALFLPLHPRDAIRPLVPLLTLNALITLVYMGGDWGGMAATLAISVLIGIPGTAICWWRHARLETGFTLRMLRRGYREMRQELGTARQIHEALFPRVIEDGPVRFRFAYEPMRQIGGDFVHVHREGGSLSGVVIDVTGHGIPAALTVNRLHGELERIFAESPGARPGEVLRLMNRYVHLTLATHSVYATAFCFRVDPSGDEIEYASAGHPPAFVLGVDGTMEELASTSFVLGAAAGDDFEPAPTGARFVRGDRLVVYTDGAIEARSPSGKMIGVAGIQRMLSGVPMREDLASRVLRTVHDHRDGPPGDDTLVVEVWRPIEAEVARVRPRRESGFLAVVA